MEGLKDDGDGVLCWRGRDEFDGLDDSFVRVLIRVGGMVEVEMMWCGVVMGYLRLLGEVSGWDFGGGR